MFTFTVSCIANLISAQNFDFFDLIWPTQISDRMLIEPVLGTLYITGLTELMELMKVLVLGIACAYSVSQVACHRD